MSTGLVAVAARDVDVDALEPRAQLALLARVLHAEGYNDHNLGHITYRLDDGTFLVDPWEVAWSEVRASDVLRMDERGRLLEGDWSVTPAIPLHLAVHRVRGDIRWVLNNHPTWAAVAAAQRRLPAPYDQMACFVDDDDVAIFSDYDGPVIEKDIATSNAMALGNRNMALLANHGVLVVGPSMRLAFQRAAMLAWRCRLGWMVQVAGGAFAVDQAVANGLANRPLTPEQQGSNEMTTSTVEPPSRTTSTSSPTELARLGRCREEQRVWRTR